MNDPVVDYEFISRFGPWTWAEIIWGVEHHLIDRDALRGYAVDRIADGSDSSLELEIAGLGQTELDEGLLLAKKLVPLDGMESEKAIQRKWLIPVLADLYAKREKFADPLGEVERVYADFDYPEEMESFVRYMPATDGYDPSRYTLEQNNRRLFEKWNSFIQSDCGM